ncbi:hypothetical protein CEXT_172591 [Caerostris extrusa]|uniref:Uncharacterized protein n=1 Tax=Caerostris extrusa TaxID=172846 RepID=A0AAV4VIK2_CAEEX|nr:hypothetical protein CEXT_172591 [Caerostris extrusa]
MNSSDRVVGRRGLTWEELSRKDVFFASAFFTNSTSVVENWGFQISSHKSITLRSPSTYSPRSVASFTKSCLLPFIIKDI